MILCEQYNTLTGTIAKLEPDEVVPALAQRDAVLWVDLQNPEESELNWLQQTFNFHPLALEDVRNQRQRAKVDRYTGYYFFVMRAIHHHPRAHRVDSTQVNLFIGLNYLVTVHREPIAALDDARARWEESRLPAEATSYLFYLVTDAVVDSYFPVIDAIGDLIDDLDKELLSKPTRATIGIIFDLRRSLLTIRKILAPQRDAFNELIRSEEGGKIFHLEQTRVYFSDVYDHILRQTDFVDTYRDMLSGSMDAYQSSLSNKLNENMQRLTVAATVLATSTVITGFFGMNLQGMGINSPWPYGGLLTLIILVVITVIEIWIFYRMKWI